MLGLVGKKIGQTRVYDDVGNLVSVTVVEAGPNRVVQVRTEETDGYSAVQLGFGDQKDSRVNKPDLGHLKKHGVPTVRRLREFRNFSKEVKPGDELNVDLFEKGDFIDAIGMTKGKGFAGVMRRFNFGGGWASHGSKGFRRRPGSAGQGTYPGNIDKGKKMPGHMGQVRRTTQNLEIVQVRPEENILLIKGSIPGAAGDYVVIRESKKMPKGTKKAPVDNGGKKKKK